MCRHCKSHDGSPKLIFADEPTGALNKANSMEVLSLLTELNASGQSILMVTHDVWAAIHGTRILYLVLEGWGNKIIQISATV